MAIVPTTLPLIMDSSHTASESAFTDTPAFAMIIILIVVILIVLSPPLIKKWHRKRIKRIVRMMTDPSYSNRKKRTTLRRHRVVFNTTRTAITRLWNERLRRPEAAHVLDETSGPVPASRPPLSNPVLPSAHLSGEDAFGVPESPLPFYQRHAFAERLPAYESLDQRDDQRETRRNWYGRPATRPSSADHQMSSMLVDHLGINWLVTPSNDSEDDVEGRFNISAIRPPWMLNEEDIEESDEESA
ncbi:hypothetical protein MMC11_005075 [Xylographa trunciseda]|nr:hypothetical protein [Xylographa trunciseda]